MLQLPNGCRCSQPSVFPKNWKTSKLSIKKPWRIQYYFYPANSVKGKLFVLKDGLQMSEYEARKKAAKVMLEELLIVLQQEGFNPITDKKYVIRDIQTKRFLRLGDGLLLARDGIKKSIEHDTWLDVKSIMKYTYGAAIELGFATIPLSDIKRIHIKEIFDYLANTRNFSANRYNRYRTYLIMLFDYLLDEVQAVEMNFVRTIKKQKTMQKLRDTLTDKQRKTVNDHLKNNYYTFWRFLQIFYHSGIRPKELLSVRLQHIDIDNQRFKLTTRKGNHREQWSPIKNSIVYLWKEVMAESGKPTDFLFHEDLRPGNNEQDKPILRSQITRRWKTHIKDALNITADFYSIKHLNLDEIAEELDIIHAARMAGHTTPVITLKHYAKGEGGRQEKRIKGVNNSFS